MLESDMEQVKNIEQIFNLLWQDYQSINPDAQKIYDLIKARGEVIVNDHIALRTFNHPKVNIEILARPFIELGYSPAGEYHFEEKKLYAKHFEHPQADLPKVFISELRVELFDETTQQIINGLIDQMDSSICQKENFLVSGAPWQCSIEIYNKLKVVSEYAAWMAAYGFRPNHFTVLVNKLKTFNELSELNQYLKANGYKLNEAGGEIKGSASVYLEQSSTLAATIKHRFSDGELTIPSCYYEFAKRYEMADGKLYQGFVAKSADKIFESTDRGQ
jgi:hypothetical protein